MERYLMLLLFLQPSWTLYESFLCPSLSEWRFRSNWYCNGTSNERYTCLYHEIQKTFVESCIYKPDSLDPGEQYIISHHPRGVNCINEYRFQPFRILLNGGPECIFRRSMCSEEGQIIFNNGTFKDDRSCRCNFKKGFALNITTQHPCQCIPSKEDCSCYKKHCPTDYVLTPDYVCVHRNNRTYISSCPDISPKSSIKESDNKLKHILNDDSHDSRQTSKEFVWLILVVVLILGFLVVGLIFDSVSTYFYCITCPPNDFTVSNEADYLKFTWSNPAYVPVPIKEYRIYFTKTSTDKWNNEDFWTVEPDKLYFSKSCSDILPSRVYRFRISIYINNSHKRKHSNEINICVPGDPPSNFNVTARKYLAFTWSKPNIGSDYIRHYNIYFTTDDSSSYNWENAEPFSVTAEQLNHNWTDANIIPSKTYRFRISTYFHNSVESKQSNEITCVIRDVLPPKNFKARGENGTVELHWTKADQNLFETEKYKIQASTDNWQTIVHEEYISSEHSNYTVTEVDQTKVYRFKIYSYSKEHFSEPKEALFYAGMGYKVSVPLQNIGSECADSRHPYNKIIKTEAHDAVKEILEGVNKNLVIKDIDVKIGSVYVVIVIASEGYDEETALRKAFKTNLERGIFGQFKTSNKGFEFMTLNRPMPPQHINVDTNGSSIQVSWSVPPQTFFPTKNFIIQYTSDGKDPKEKLVSPEYQNCSIPLESSAKLIQLKNCTEIKNSIRSKPSSDLLLEIKRRYFLSGIKLDFEVEKEISQQTHVLSDHVHTLFTETESQFIVKLRNNLKELENDLQKSRFRFTMTKLDTEFQHLLSRISGNLTSEDVKSVRFLLTAENKIPVQKLDAATTGNDIFQLMTKHGLLSKTKTDILITFLKEKNLQPHVNELKKFKTENELELSQPLEGPYNIQKDIVVEHFFETTKLEELTSKMEMENFAVLSGLAGCGKTQLALTFACNFRKDHVDSICWKLFCMDEITLMNSLKKLADALGLEKDSPQMENIDNQDSVKELRKLIPKELSKKIDGPNLIILDNVTDETKIQCQKLKDALLKLNVKVIVTTRDSTFCDTDNIIIVNGFSEDEAVMFLLNKKKPLYLKEVNSCITLAQMLCHHPLLLFGARSCMASSNESPSNFIKHLRRSKSSEMDTYVRSISKPFASGNREVFKILREYLKIVKNDYEEDVFNMMQALQFFALEDIPVLLFDFFPSREQNHQGVNTRNFIQAIKMFSFGIIRGVDDDRFITTHYAVVKTIEESMSDEKKASLIKNVLTSLMWLMDKDNYNQIDYNRNNRLLPHAISVLQHVKKLQAENLNLLCDFESSVLLAYVYDIVGYTYNFFGILKNGGEHSSAAKEACFAILGISEEEIEKQVMQRCFRDNHHRTWEIFAEEEADIIFKQIKVLIEDGDKNELLCKMAKQLAVNKYRGQDYIKKLEEYLEDELEEEYRLTEREYEELCKQRLALPEDQIGGIFLFELVLQVFYTYGRRIFYLGDAFQNDVARSFTHFLFLAKALGKRIASEYPEWKILYVMLTELSGTLQLRFEDKADLQLKTLENLEDAAEQFKRLLECNNENFNYGLIKSGPENAQHVYICCKRLVQCYSSMTEITSDVVKLKEIHEKGDKYKDMLNGTLYSCRAVTAANLRMAEFSLRRRNYEDAEIRFKFVAPEDMIEYDLEIVSAKFTHHELKALKGLTKCYAFSGQTKSAKTLANRIKIRLGLAKEYEELGHYNNLMQELGLSSVVDTK